MNKFHPVTVPVQVLVPTHCAATVDVTLTNGRKVAQATASLTLP